MIVLSYCPVLVRRCHVAVSTIISSNGLSYSDELDEDPDRLPPSEDTAQGPACVLTLCALCFKSVDHFGNLELFFMVCFVFTWRKIRVKLSNQPLQMNNSAKKSGE